MQTGKPFRPPHLHHAAAVLDDEEDLVPVDARKHFTFGFDVGPHVAIGSQTNFVILYADAFHPIDRFRAVFFVAAGAEDYVNAGIVQYVAQPHDRSDGLVFGHSFEESLPVFRVTTDVVLPCRNIRQCAVYVEYRYLIHGPIIASERKRSLYSARTLNAKIFCRDL